MLHIKKGKGRGGDGGVHIRLSLVAVAALSAEDTANVISRSLPALAIL